MDLNSKFPELSLIFKYDNKFFKFLQKLDDSDIIFTHEILDEEYAELTFFELDKYAVDVFLLKYNIVPVDYVIK